MKRKHWAGARKEKKRRRKGKMGQVRNRAQEVVWDLNPFLFQVLIQNPK
jgi:hypothetical protein